MEHVANTAWAFGTGITWDDKPFVALVAGVERRLSDCNRQNLANKAWEFATVNYRDEKLFVSGNCQHGLGVRNGEVP